MPIFDTTAWGTANTDPLAPPTGSKPKTGFVDGLAATWQQESVWVANKVRPSLEYPDDHSFDFHTYDKGYWPLVAQARNREHADALVAQYDHEKANKEIMDNQGWALGLTTNIAVGLTNPLNLIGFGGAKTVVGAIGRGAAGAVLGTSLTEPILHARQVDRSLEESAMNIAGAALIGGPLGGAGKLIGNKFSRGGFLSNEVTLLDLTALNQAMGFGGGQSVGAAQAMTRTMADSDIARMPPWMTRFALFGDYSRSANQRLSTSKFEASRNAANLLFRQNLATTENLAGVANHVPIEIAVGQRFGEGATRLMEADNNFRGAWWKKVEGGTYSSDDIMAELRRIDPSLPPDYALSPTSFDRVLKAYMADGTSFGGSMPEVVERVKTGAKLREQIDADKIDYGLAEKDQLIDIATGERLAKDSDVIPNSKTHKYAYEDGSHYLSRVFDKGRIMGNRDGFIRDLIEGWKARNPDLDLSEPDALDGLSAAANKVADKLLNLEDAVSLGDLLKNLDLPGKYTKGRTLNVDDRYLVNWTHDNVMGSELYHLSQATVDVELAKQGLKFQDLVNALNTEFKERVDQANAEFGINSAKAKNAIGDLARERQKDLAELEYGMRRLKRQAAPGSANPMMRSLSNGIGRLNKVAGMAQLGGSAIPTSLPDIASVARNFGHARTITTMLKSVFSSDFRKDIVENAKQVGVLSDMINTTVRELHIDEQLNQSLDPNKGFKTVGMQRVDNVLDRGADVFAKVSLIETWAKIGRTVASAASTQHIIDAAGKGWASLSKTRQMDLAKFYIDEDMLGRIQKQIDLHADEANGTKFAAVERWDDEEAARRFQSSVYAHTEHALNIPSVGSGSTFMSETIFGRVFMRFKSFNNAAHESTFLASLQNREVSRVVTATLHSAFWSFLSVIGYDAITGRDTSMEKYFGDVDKSTKTAWKMLTKSGYVAASQDAFVNGSKFFGSIPGPIGEGWREAFPAGLEDEIFPKFDDITAAEKIVGPTYGYVSQAFKTAGGLIDGDVTDKDIGAVRNLLPGQNIGWLRRGIDYVEEFLGGRPADRNANK